MSNKRRRKRSKGLDDRFAMRIAPTVHKELKRLAAAENRSLSNYVHRILEQHVNGAHDVVPASRTTPPPCPPDEDVEPARKAA